MESPSLPFFFLLPSLLLSFLPSKFKSFLFYLKYCFYFFWVINICSLNSQITWQDWYWKIVPQAPNFLFLCSLSQTFWLFPLAFNFLYFIVLFLNLSVLVIIYFFLWDEDLELLPHFIFFSIVSIYIDQLVLLNSWSVFILLWLC